MESISKDSPFQSTCEIRASTQPTNALNSSSAWASLIPIMAMSAWGMPLIAEGLLLVVFANTVSDQSLLPSPETQIALGRGTIIFLVGGVFAMMLGLTALKRIPNAGYHLIAGSISISLVISTIAAIGMWIHFFAPQLLK